MIDGSRETAGRESGYASQPFALSADEKQLRDHVLEMTRVLRELRQSLDEVLQADEPQRETNRLCA